MVSSLSRRVVPALAVVAVLAMVGGAADAFVTVTGIGRRDAEMAPSLAMLPPSSATPPPDPTPPAAATSGPTQAPTQAPTVVATAAAAAAPPAIVGSIGDTRADGVVGGDDIAAFGVDGPLAATLLCDRWSPTTRPPITVTLTLVPVPDRPAHADAVVAVVPATCPGALATDATGPADGPRLVDLGEITAAGALPSTATDYPGSTLRVVGAGTDVSVVLGAPARP